MDGRRCLQENFRIFARCRTLLAVPTFCEPVADESARNVDRHCVSTKCGTERPAGGGRQGSFCLVIGTQDTGSEGYLHTARRRCGRRVRYKQEIERVSAAQKSINILIKIEEREAPQVDSGTAHNGTVRQQPTEHERGMVCCSACQGNPHVQGEEVPARRARCIG